jgi:hypothetical protein
VAFFLATFFLVAFFFVAFFFVAFFFAAMVPPYGSETEASINKPKTK